MPLLVVQRGHCYRKTGATGTTGEQAYATAVANACVNLLHGRGGWTVRAILADEATSAYSGDAFVAIHCDGSVNATARGASVGYRTPEGQQFGQAWKRHYQARGWSGGFRADNYTDALAGYYGTGNAVAVGNRRAFIAECGFRTNAQDRALLDGPGGPTRVALAIGDALGIPHNQPEDDMPTAQEVANAILNTKITRQGSKLGGTVTLGQMLAWYDAALEKEAARDAGLQAAVTALSKNPAITPAQLATVVDQAVDRHTPSATEIATAIDVAQRPHIQAAVRAVLGEDNADQADQIVDELVERLANPTPNPEGN